MFVGIERDKKRFVVSLNERVHQLEKELARLKQDRDRLARERDEYRKLYELVMLELERVRRHLRAQNKSERVDAAQVQLAFAEIANLVVPPDLAEQIADAENRARLNEPRKPSKPHGRSKLPEHLPVERIELHPPEPLRTCSCCGNAMRVIGEEMSEQLDYRPASLVRMQTARIKYACACEKGGVVIASVPDAPVERGMAGPGLLAHVAISKYDDHQPLYRVTERFTREKVPIARSTLGDWVEQVADLLRPIADAMAIAALAAHRIHTDDTGIPILETAKPTRDTSGSTSPMTITSSSATPNGARRTARASFCATTTGTSKPTPPTSTTASSAKPGGPRPKWAAGRIIWSDALSGAPTRDVGNARAAC